MIPFWKESNCHAWNVSIRLSSVLKMCGLFFVDIGFKSRVSMCITNQKWIDKPLVFEWNTKMSEEQQSVVPNYSCMGLGMMIVLGPPTIIATLLPFVWDQPECGQPLRFWIIMALFLNLFTLVHLCRHVCECTCHCPPKRLTRPSAVVQYEKVQSLIRPDECPPQPSGPGAMQYGQEAKANKGKLFQQITSGCLIILMLGWFVFSYLALKQAANTIDTTECPFGQIVSGPTTLQRCFPCMFQQSYLFNLTCAAAAFLIGLPLLALIFDFYQSMRMDNRPRQDSSMQRSNLNMPLYPEPA